MQAYLYSNVINKTEAQHLFMFRTRMTMFINNFRNGSADIKCPLCSKSNSVDSEAHSLTCDKIINRLSEVKNINVNNLYSEDLNVLKETINVFMKILDIRKEYLTK